MKFEGTIRTPTAESGAIGGRTTEKKEEAPTARAKDKGKGKSKEKQGKTKGKGKNANSNGGRGDLKNCCTVLHRCQEEQLEKIELTLDSRSAVSACPEHVGEVSGVASPASGFKYVTADGRASVQDEDGRRLQVVTEMETEVNLNMRVAGMHKAYVAARDVTDQGDVVILGKFDSFVAHDRRGRIHRAAHKASSSAPEFWLYKTNGVYTFPVWFWGEHQTSAQAGASICPVAVPAASMTHPSRHQKKQRQDHLPTEIVCIADDALMKFRYTTGCRACDSANARQEGATSTTHT